MKKFLLCGLYLLMVMTLFLTLSVNALAAESAPVETIPEAEEENELSILFDALSENSDKIFSLLAFVSSIIVIFIYKRGLIPLVNTGLCAMKKSTDDFDDKASESLTKTERSLDILTSKFISLENGGDMIAKGLSEISERLEGMIKSEKEKQLFKNVMLSQIDMLYEVFMQSGLPQYSKDALGERVAKMKKSLAEGE